MEKNNQGKPSGSSPITKDSKPIAITKVDIGSIKNGRITSEAPTRPQKPAKVK
jgi:hypothetical protein